MIEEENLSFDHKDSKENNSIGPSSNLQTIPTPRPTTPPHRKLPARKPLKSILKPTPPPQPKFNFKRDILNPFSNKLGYAAIEESPLSAVVGNGTVSVGQGVQAAAGWVGNAWKKLNVVNNLNIQENNHNSSNQQQPQLNTSSNSISNNPNHQINLIQSSSNQSTNSFNQIQSNPSQSHNSSIKTLTNHLPISKINPSSNTLTQTILLTPTIHPNLNNSSSIHSTSPNSQLSISNLKKVHFIMSDLKIIYPISNSQPPSFDHLNKLRINQARKLLISNRNSLQNSNSNSIQSNSSIKNLNVNGWTARNLELLYDECCQTREEGWGIIKLREIIKRSSPLPPKIINLSGVPLNRLGSVQVLGDLLSVDFGLKSLNLSSCSLEDNYLKPILHGLLVSGTLPTLNLSSNRKIRTKGWKMIAVFVKKAKELLNLDLSDNPLDRRSLEYLVQAIAGNIPKDHQDTIISPTFNSSKSNSANNHSNSQISTPFDQNSLQNSSISTNLIQHEELDSNSKHIKSHDDPSVSLFPLAPLLREDHSPALQALSAISTWPNSDASNLISLRLDNCNLKPNQLDTLAYGLRLSKLKHVSLRKNRIGNLGAISLAVMIRDWPTHTGSAASNDGFAARLNVPFDQDSNQDIIDKAQFKISNKLEISNSVTARQNDFLSQSQLQSSTTPSLLISEPLENQLSIEKDHDESSTNSKSSKQLETKNPLTDLIQEEIKKANEQRFKLKSKIDQLPTIGQLLTLDVKSNELKSQDVFYLSQVLKKNRTLKVLNLAENKIDALGLVYLADALRYNTSLETLDLSRNPCCGPNLEGLLALRMTCTINASLKRVFLSKTELNSQGSIAIAEFLPEMNNLIHLDLTENYGIDIAGVMALAVSVKMNTSLRCLDINIPPNDPDFSCLSQDILQSCVRNTELAQQQVEQRGAQITIYQPMLKSTVVKALADQQQQSNPEFIQSPSPKPKSSKPLTRSTSSVSSTEIINKILASAAETCDVLKDLIREDERRKIRTLTSDRKLVMAIECSELVKELLDQIKASQVQIQEALESFGSNAELKARALSIMSQLTEVLEYSDMVYKEPCLKGLSSPKAQSSSIFNDPSKLSISLPTTTKSSHQSDLTSQDNNLALENQSNPLEDDCLKIKDPPDEIGLLNKNQANNSALSLIIQTRPSKELGLNDKDDSIIDLEESNQDSSDESDSTKTINNSPKSPVESHSRSLTIEEGEVFRKGSVLGTAVLNENEDDEIPGEILKESILVTEVQRIRKRGEIKIDDDSEDENNSIEKDLNQSDSSDDDDNEDMIQAFVNNSNDSES